MRRLNTLTSLTPVHQLCQNFFAWDWPMTQAYYRRERSQNISKVNKRSHTPSSVEYSILNCPDCGLFLRLTVAKPPLDMWVQWEGKTSVPTFPLSLSLFTPPASCYSFLTFCVWFYLRQLSPFVAKVCFFLSSTHLLNHFPWLMVKYEKKFLPNLTNNCKASVQFVLIGMCV